MDIRLLSSDDDLREYDLWLRGVPGANLWQSTEWKTYQEAIGREVRIYLGREAPGGDPRIGALVSIDRTTFNLATWDLPRGPLWNPSVSAGEVEDFLSHILDEARRDRCLQLFCSPQTPLPFTHPWKASGRHVQPDATRTIDLRAPQEALLAQMHQKGRYNIKVAEKHGVRIERSDDMSAFYDLLQSTSDRDAFRILPKRHYERFIATLPGSFLLLAYEGSTAIAGLIGVTWGDTGFYYYGASSYAHRALMAPYLLQWHAMRHCKDHGCASYDLLGVAPEEAPPSHPWHGVSSFKEKFGGVVVSYPQERFVIFRPVLSGFLMVKRRILG